MRRVSHAELVFYDLIMFPKRFHGTVIVVNWSEETVEVLHLKDKTARYSVMGSTPLALNAFRIRKPTPLPHCLSERYAIGLHHIQTSVLKACPHLLNNLVMVCDYGSNKKILADEDRAEELFDPGPGQGA